MTAARQILLVEDERGIAEGLSRLLAAEGYGVTVAKDVRSATAEARGRTPDLVILDWMLPDGQGIDLLRAWRLSGLSTPVIMLTARHELVDKVLGLEMGADDFVTKPFEARELLARIKARFRLTPGRTFAHAGINIDDLAHLVTFEGCPVELTKMEYALLKLLVEHAGQVFSRDELLNRVWGFDAYPTTRTVDTHVLQLRQKLRSELIETVRGVGYRMRKEELTTN